MSSPPAPPIEAPARQAHPRQCSVQCKSRAMHVDRYPEIVVLLWVSMDKRFVRKSPTLE